MGLKIILQCILKEKLCACGQILCGSDYLHEADPYEHGNETSGSTKGGEVDLLIVRFSRRTLQPGIG
jgi:hypothetical protein